MRVRLEQFRQARRIHGGTLNMLGAALGVRLARTHIPTAILRRKVFRMIYGRKYEALDETELEKPLEDYTSLNELFTRGVRHGLRTIPERTDLLLSPVDGTVQDIGQLEQDTVMTVKGVRYTLNSLCPDTDTTAYENGHFAILFLSPRDCHRVFAPADGILKRMVHVPGNRLLVHPEHQSPEFPVFALNERLVMQLDTRLGRCLLVLVAGWGVGNITHPFPVGMRFSPRRVTTTRVDPMRTVSRAEWIATFELGSTVILIAEQSCASTSIVTVNDSVHYGQPLFNTINESDSAEP
jgi:phosphatidylserine decarboxylase